MQAHPTARRHCVFLATTLALAAGLALIANAQEFDLTEEDKVKLTTLNEFLQGIDDFLPTVNLVPEDRLPVTFPYKDLHDHIVVDVAFGDDEPLPFMFDTGAGTFVTQAIADRHGGEVLVEQGGAAGGNKLIWNPLQVYPSLTIGGVLQIDQPTAITPWQVDGSMYCVTPHGLLGAPAMRNAVWQVNYADKTLTAAASVDQLDHIEDAIAVPFTSKGLSPSPSVELGIGDARLNFVVDTGGGIPMTINTASLEKTGLAVPKNAPRIDNLAAGAAGAFAAPMQFMEIPVDFGGTTVNTLVAIGDGMAPLSDGNIGHFFLRNFIATFDWSTNTIYLDPITDDGSASSMPNPSAAAFSWAGGQLIVSTVVAGGPAAEAGLKIGDVVTHVDGESVEGLSLDQYCELMADEERHTSVTVGGKTYPTLEMDGFFSKVGGGQ